MRFENVFCRYFCCSHIYIPLGGSHRGKVRQVLASVACFSFTCFYHGAMDHLLAWTTFNIVIVSAEAVADCVVDTPAIMDFEVKSFVPKSSLPHCSKFSVSKSGALCRGSTWVQPWFVGSVLSSGFRWGCCTQWPRWSLSEAGARRISSFRECLWKVRAMFRTDTLADSMEELNSVCFHWI